MEGVRYEPLLLRREIDSSLLVMTRTLDAATTLHLLSTLTTVNKLRKVNTIQAVLEF